MAVLSTLILLLGTFYSYKLLMQMLRRISVRKNVPEKRIFYIEKVLGIILFFTSLLLLSLIWSIDLKGASLIVSSVFAVVGVALFAQWSILSSVTASIIIFFTFPAKIGDRIRIVDGDDSMEGEIIEISLFQIEMRNASGDIILYPNNQLLQKPVIKLTDTDVSAVGEDDVEPTV